MPNQEIVNYITQTKEKGYTGEQITQALKLFNLGFTARI